MGSQLYIYGFVPFLQQQKKWSRSRWKSSAARIALITAPVERSVFLHRNYIQKNQLSGGGGLRFFKKVEKIHTKFPYANFIFLENKYQMLIFFGVEIFFDIVSMLISIGAVFRAIRAAEPSQRAQKIKQILW